MRLRPASDLSFERYDASRAALSQAFTSLQSQ